MLVTVRTVAGRLANGLWYESHTHKNTGKRADPFLQPTWTQHEEEPNDS